jgi:hypothetical protein
MPAIASAMLDVAANAMITSLSKHLPPPLADLPAPVVSLVNLTERSVGLGGLRSGDVTGNAGSIMRRGIRVDALTRFQLWAPDANGINQAVADLQMQVLADRENLRSEGFVRLALEDTGLSVPVAPPDGPWHGHVDWRVLYEYDYEDTDGAESLIAQIPVTINTGSEESMTLTDEMARWDNNSAPKLAVRGPVVVAGLTLLAFVPRAVPSGKVTLWRTFDGAAGAPLNHASLADFLAAISAGNPERNAITTFSSFNTFKAAFQDTGDTVTLGDWDGDGVADVYQSLTLSIEPAVTLPTVRDRLEVTYGAAKFNQVAVAYLRAIRG